MKSSQTTEATKMISTIEITRWGKTRDIFWFVVGNRKALRPYFAKLIKEKTRERQKKFILFFYYVLTFLSFALWRHFMQRHINLSTSDRNLALWQITPLAKLKIPNQLHFVRFFYGPRSWIIIKQEHFSCERVRKTVASAYFQEAE